MPLHIGMLFVLFQLNLSRLLPKPGLLGRLSKDPMYLFHLFHMQAIELLNEIAAQRLKHNKLKSAMLTTRGGALRDLERFHEAQKAGEEAHALLAQDYRPCTLLGAVHIQQGNYEQGYDWYRKAEKRGAPAEGNDQEIRSILRRMPQEKRQKAIAELIRIDPDRFSALR